VRADHMTKYCAILCAKGGVGKTTTTINLASALIAFGREVIAVDADFTAPNLSIHLGVPNLPKSIHEALEGHIPLSECLYFHPSGLRIVPGNMAYESAKEINLTNFPLVLRDLHQKAEIVLIDGAPGVSPEAIALIQSVDGIIAVTTPDLAAVSDTRKTIKMANEHGKNILGVIVNRVRGEAHEMPLENIETFLDTKVIGVIPEDSNIRSAYQLNGPVQYTHPDSHVAEAYKKLASVLLGEEYSGTVEKEKLPSLKKGLMNGWKIV
jgi:septum site-determining protein MinD